MLLLGIIRIHNRYLYRYRWRLLHSLIITNTNRTIRLRINEIHEALHRIAEVYH
jgi:hypothetical protein